MEIKKAQKLETPDVEFLVIDENEIRAFYEARLKTIELFGSQFKIFRKKNSDSNKVKHRFTLDGFGLSLMDGMVYTDSGEWFRNMKEFKTFYKEIKEDEGGTNNE